MNGDVLLLAPRHEKAAKDILELALPKRNGRMIIAVGGESGSGKSEVGHMLRKELQKHKIQSKVLSTDNYYKTSPAERTEWRKKNGIECIGYNEYDWDLINKSLEHFRNADKRVELPFLDIVTGQQDTLITNFAEVEILILEGLYSVQADADFKALIDITYHETKKAQILRGKEAVNDFRMQVLEQEHQVVQSLRDQVDFFVKYEDMSSY